MYKFNNDEELKNFINENIISTAEAIEILGCSRQNLDNLVKQKKLIPVKSINYIRLYLKSDILARVKKP